VFGKSVILKKILKHEAKMLNQAMWFGIMNSRFLITVTVITELLYLHLITNYFSIKKKILVSLKSA
jgi:hypothetical protein